ncbi:transcriptional regulator with XRE-family HTH domain [Moryella indoligenes]|uniref:Transcriptional regulator with XRE-family HTH domain n=1 Tax=Moryella indoligenes TaxID=371674 RepID=A0AAE4AM10_9FIRM|nr:helix-turn-helix transcriptional regulator [Moryella indoligenes]MDQ0153684.1 transcriptional regulator with XRE-family HTH domain [Moryella indoligenes]
MPEDIQKRIFSRNLNKLLEKQGKTQLEVANAIGVSPQSFNTWTQGKILPRMGKIQLLADYFGINKSDLLEERTEDTGYYFNPETAKVAQEVFENRDLRILFDAARDASPEDIKTATGVLKALLAKERGKDDETGA